MKLLLAYRVTSKVLALQSSAERWVPRLFSKNHKQPRLTAARNFVEMVERDGEELYSCIVTGDETWVHHTTPETKRKSMV